MARLIEIKEVDEFANIVRIPNSAINEIILTNIRKLDEKTELEQAIREILFDPNETPHGPTEIADILTTHVHIRGEKRIAAFVLKGKGCQSVSSRNVTHQFVKLWQVPEIGLMIFGAVGNIQDDAQRDFIETATKANCDYLIIDAIDWARLFISYEKICVKDGTPYDDTGMCMNGHMLDEGVSIEIKVREELKYDVINQKDISHPGAKRYSASVLTDSHYTKEVIRDIIQKVTEKLKCSNYHRNDWLKERWKDIPAHVVCLYLAFDLRDIQYPNWVCRTIWIDPSLPEDMRPHGINGNERLGDIEILWNDDYAANKKLIEEHCGTKEEVLEKIKAILDEIIDYANKAIDYFKKYKSGEIKEAEFSLMMQEMEPRVTELHLLSGDLPFPPEDCKRYDEACQNIIATIHDMFIPYSKKGLEKWSTSSRDWLLEDCIKRFKEHLQRVKIEESELN